MRKQSIALVLGLVLLSGSAFDAQPAHAGSPETATGPTGAEISAQAPLPLRLLHHARQYRGNPVWLGVVVGALLLVALGGGAVVLLRHSSRAS